MQPRCCRFCQELFAPSPFHPEQAVCSAALCQRLRRHQNRKRQLARDAEYRQVCRDSARKWRANHPGYWKGYRAAQPGSVERNRTQQRQRDLRRRLSNLANNNLASAQVFILQAPNRQAPLPEASCKQHPSGWAAALA